jgi:hypothetical protein
VNSDDLIDIARPAVEQFRLEPEFPDEDQVAAPLAIQEDIPLSAEAVSMAAMMGRITAKLNIELERLENAGKAIAQVVNGITPTDQATYTELCERVGDCKEFLDGADQFIDPWKQLFYRPYQGVLERQKQIIGVPKAAHGAGVYRRLEFERAVKAAEDAETLRLQAEQKKREEDTRIQNAQTAEALGMSEQAIDTLLTQPSVAPTPVAAPMISRPQGVRKIAANWQAELTDKQAFWKWAKAQKEMPACLLIDQPAMNREAKTHKATLGQRFPGWRGVNKGGD